jgi:hypothetical protein
MQRPSPDAERPYLSYWRQLGETIAAIFMVAVMGNYPWELAQAPLYVGMESFRAVWWHCFVASLGDGLLILGIFVAGWMALGRQTWFVHPGVWGYGVMLTTGLVISGVIEWVAVHLLGRWMYTAQMPLVPGLAIGVVPVVQMIILPPLIFHIVAVWYRRTAGPT